MTAPGAPLPNSWPQCSDSQIEFFWEPPASDGGSPITHYTLACSDIAFSQDISANVPSYLVTGLTNATPYTFTITATNSFGTGPATTYPTVEPGFIPFGPSAATVSTLNVSTALVSWTPSTIAGEGRTRTYVIECYPSSLTMSSFSKTKNSYQNFVTFDNLSTNVYYKFLVLGVNDVGYCNPFAYTETLGFGVNDVVTSGLIVRFDATSYSGSGAWSNTGSLGSNYDATIENGTPSKNGAGNGVVFNGTTNFLFSNVSVGNAWSAEMWVKRTGTGDLGSCFLTQQFNGTSLNAAIFTNFVTGNGKNASATQAAGGFFTSAAWRNTTATDLSLNTWVNLAYTWDGTTLVGYSNGTAYDSNTPGVAAVDSGLPYRIGRRWDTVTLPNYIRGEVGQLLFYNRGITASEVSANYAATAPTFSV